MGYKKIPKKNSAQSVQPFGRPYATYLYTNDLFYYIDNLYEKDIWIVNTTWVVWRVEG